MKQSKRMTAIAAAQDLTKVLSVDGETDAGVIEVRKAAALAAWRTAARIALDEVIEAFGKPCGKEMFINRADALMWIGAFGIESAMQAAMAPYQVEWPYSPGWEIEAEAQARRERELSWD